MIQKARGFAGFIVINTILSLILASQYYLEVSFAPTSQLGWGFLTLGTFSHISLLALLIGTLCLPILLLPKPLWMILIALVAASAQIALFIDIQYFKLFNHHTNLLFLEQLFKGYEVDFNLPFWGLLAGAIALTVIEAMLLNKLVKKIKKSSRWFPKYIGLTVVSFLAASAIHIWAAAHNDTEITSMKQYLPVYHPVTANTFLKKHGFLDEDK